MAQVGTLGAKFAGIGYNALINMSAEIANGVNDGLDQYQISKNVLVACGKSISTGIFSIKLSSIFGKFGKTKNSSKNMGKVLTSLKNIFANQEVKVAGKTLFSSIIKRLNGGYRK